MSTATSTKWTFVCQLRDLPVLGARRVGRPKGMDVAVFRTADDKVYALLDRCPHRGGPLSQGIVFGTSVACPLHNWTIDLSQGQAYAPDEGCTPRFTVRLDDGNVYLDARELSSLGLAFSAPLAGPAHRCTLAT